MAPKYTREATWKRTEIPSHSPRIKSEEMTDWTTWDLPAGEGLGVPWRPSPEPQNGIRVLLLKKQGHQWAWLELAYVATEYFHFLFIFEKHGGYIHSPRTQQNFWFCFWPLLRLRQPNYPVLSFSIHWMELGYGQLVKMTRWTFKIQLSNCNYFKFDDYETFCQGSHPSLPTPQ